MAIRQYVGARYVPRFMGTLDPTQEYEALDVVDNGSGTSYIARKIVPPGTPLTDNEYWFLYGASSGAIVQLQNDMIRAQNDINGLEDDVDYLYKETTWSKRRVLFLGDSYDTFDGGWAPKVAAKLGCQYVQVSAGGYGIDGGGYQNLKYIDLLTNTVISNPETITDVVICGGGNDRGVAYADLSTSMYQLNAYIMNRFPNIINKYIGFIYWSYTNNGLQNQAETAYNNYLRLSDEYQYKWLENCEWIMHDSFNIRRDIGDYSHPTDAAVATIAGFIAAAMNGHPLTYRAYRTFTMTGSGDFEGVGGQTFSGWWKQINADINLSLGLIALHKTTAGDITINTAIEILDTDDVFIPFRSDYLRLPVLCQATDPNSNRSIPTGVTLYVSGVNLNKIMMRTAFNIPVTVAQNYAFPIYNVNYQVI